MKHLILMRHAKSDWGDAALDDHDRPLNDRGRRDAPKLGRWLRDTGHLPDEVLCSTARRARETWDALGLDGPEPRYLPDLYHASPGTLLRVLRGATGARVLVIAHNPGIGQFAGLMARAAPDHRRFAAYPTAATTVIDFDTDEWSAVALGEGTITNFVVPKDL